MSNQYITLIVSSSDRVNIQNELRTLLNDENLAIQVPLVRPNEPQVITHYCCTFTVSQINVDALAQFPNIVILTGHPIQQLSEANFQKYEELDE